MKQSEKILNAFRSNNNVLTPSDMLRLGIAQYNARVKELREKGYEIENQYLGSVNGIKHTRFILKGKAVIAKPKMTIHEYASANNPTPSLW
uniref:Putative DNA binding, helix-turn-helix domain containing protein n=1 Tax=viral metagenome TaxID=1070528 RepID=A0A6H2A0L4_9ZZZZ